MVLDIIVTNLSSVLSKKNILRIWKDSESEYAPFSSNYIFEWGQLAFTYFNENNISQQIECISWYENLPIVYYKGFSPPKVKRLFFSLFFSLEFFNKNFIYVNTWRVSYCYFLKWVSRLMSSVMIDITHINQSSLEVLNF